MPLLLFSQLRVIRAFRSLLEDLEEKRSVHSYHSFHSLRTSRSHHGARSHTEESNAQQNSESRFLRTISPPAPLNSFSSRSNHRGGSSRGNSSRFNSTASSTYPNLQLKSQSYENVPLVAKQRTCIVVDAPVNPVCKVSPPKKSKTLSYSDISEHTETAI